MSRRLGRTTAEWTTFAVSAAIVLSVLAVLVAQAVTTEEPAAPVARQRGAVLETAGRFFVPVDVTNEGDRTAADVQVVAELTVGGETVDGEQLVDFLAGRDTARLVFSFDDDPAEGELIVRVGGFSKP